jgi:[CysO sulfur-carrier protein]-thiocarboxylate-dependent cysteine synthase
VRLAKELASSDDRYVMLYQYGNDANPRAHYEGTAVEIIRDLPDLDVFVAGLGTGGTITGNARRLKESNPAIKVVAAEPLQGDLVQVLASHPPHPDPLRRFAICSPRPRLDPAHLLASPTIDLG